MSDKKSLTDFVQSEAFHMIIDSKGQQAQKNEENRMEYRQAVALYLDYLIVERGCTERTRTTYQSWLNRYGHWLTESGYKSQEIDVVLTETLLRRYQYCLSQGTAGGTMESKGKQYKPLRPRSVRGHFMPLRDSVCISLMCENVWTTSLVKILNCPKKMRQSGI